MKFERSISYKITTTVISLVFYTFLTFAGLFVLNLSPYGVVIITAILAVVFWVVTNRTEDKK